MRSLIGMLIGVMLAIAIATAQNQTCPDIDEGAAILFPNPANCSTFYQCYNGSLVEKNCPDGLHFNAVLEVCDWPWAANCTEVPAVVDIDLNDDKEIITLPPPECPPIGSELNATVSANPYNCSTYYICENEVPTLKACPGDLQYNPLIGVCDFSFVVNCKELSPISPSVSNDSPVQKVHDINLDDDKEIITLPPPECPPIGSELNATVSANPYNCSTYYICENEVPTLKVCPGELHFNPLIGVCDFPFAANCKELSPISPALSPVLVQVSKRALDPACRPDGPPVCPPPPAVGNVTVCPNPYNCSNYYYCDNGNAFMRDCPPGLVFDAELGSCNYDWATNCVALPPPKRTVNIEPIVEKVSKRALDPACRPDGPPVCPPPPVVGNVTVCPNPYNCSNYYYCDNGNAFMRDCPDGLVFDVELGSCNYEWATNCVALPPPNNTASIEPEKKQIPERAINPACQSNGPPSCPPPGTLGNTTICPNPYNCSNYYICDNGKPYLRDCATGLEYNAEAEACDHAWAANCVALPPPLTITYKLKAIHSFPKLVKISKRALDPACRPDGPPVCPPPPAVGNVTVCPNPYNCSNYYYCDNGNAFMRDCPPGLVFDSELGSCNYDWATNCVALPPPKRTVNIEPIVAKVPKPAAESVCQPDGPPNCPPPPGVGNVTVCPNPYNCSNYYSCDNGVASLRDCPTGLVFDVELGSCNYEWATTCVALPPPKRTVNIEPIVEKVSKRALDPACRPDGPPVCPPPPNVGNVTVCPNPYNCSNYYYCDNGNAFMRDCPNGLVFDVELGSCNYEWATNCVALPPPNNTASIEPEMKQIPELAVNSACQSNGPPSCPPPGTLGNTTICPNPYNCSNYYICDNGKPYLRDCATGLEYNAALEACDHAWAASCVALPTPMTLESILKIWSSKYSVEIPSHVNHANKKHHKSFESDRTLNINH